MLRALYSKLLPQWVQNTVFWTLCLQMLTGCAHDALFSVPVLQEIQSIYVCNIPERIGQIFRQNLQIHCLGTKCAAKYDLKIKIAEKEETMVLGADGRTMLIHLETSANYQLIRRKDQKCLKENTIYTYNAYDVLSSENYDSLGAAYYSTTKAIDFAKATNLDNLQSLILQDLGIFFQNNPNLCHAPLCAPRLSISQHLKTQTIK